MNLKKNFVSVEKFTLIKFYRIDQNEYIVSLKLVLFHIEYRLN